MTNPVFTKRQDQLQALIKEHKMGAVVLNPGPDLSYITGLNFHLMERPVVGTALTEAGLEKARLGAIPRHLRLLELSYLEHVLSWKSFPDRKFSNR